jgi:ubiquinone/menaquinone biosynthesis C-methylase UbiE
MALGSMDMGSEIQKDSFETMDDVQIHRPPLHWLILRLWLAGSKDQAYLSGSWGVWALRNAPNKLRQRLALELLALSPHYFVYQWSSMYPKNLPRTDVLLREFERNRASREELGEKLLKPYIRSGMTVLDFGCGPGFLARAVINKYSVRMIATDVSRGIIACAKVLNPAKDLSYMVNRTDNLRNVGDNSIDLVYSFAVFQHLETLQRSIFLKEFARILKPGGIGVCHFAVKEFPDNEEPKSKYPAWLNWVVKRVKFRMIYLSTEDIESTLIEAGFTEIRILPISTLADIDDSIGRQHLVAFKLEAVS